MIEWSEWEWDCYSHRRGCRHLAVDFICQCFHVGCDLIVNNLCVNLCCPNIAMSEHFRNRFDGNAIRERYGRGERVAREVKGQFFINAADRRDLFEIIVAFLVRGYGQHFASSKFPLVFLKNHQGNFQ